MRTERLNLRLDPATDALLREAAALAGTSLTAFLLDAGREAARRVIDDHHRLVLSREAVARLREEPPAPRRPAHVDV